MGSGAEPENKPPITADRCYAVGMQPDDISRFLVCLMVAVFLAACRTLFRSRVWPEARLNPRWIKLPTIGPYDAEADRSRLESLGPVDPRD